MFESRALGANARVSRIQYSNTTLKMIAAVMTIIGTIGIAIIENGIMNLDSYSTQTLLEAMEGEGNVMLQATLVLVCLGIGSLALPIYSKLLIEGFKKSSDISKYALRIGALALISEVPYDLAIKDSWFDMSEQNPLFGMLIALLMLYFFAYFENIKKIKGFFFKLLIIFAAILWGLLFSTYLGTIFILLTAVLWLLDGNGAFTTAMGCVVSMFQFPAPFGFIFTHFYNGEKGRINRWVFYIIYPAQLLILGLIGKYLL